MIYAAKPIQISKKLLLHLLYFLPALLFCVCIRIIRPFRIIQVGTFSTYRIGHFVMDTIRVYRELLKPKYAKKAKIFIWLPENTANETWRALTQKHFKKISYFHCTDIIKYIAFWNQILPCSKAHVFNANQYLGVLHANENKGNENKNLWSNMWREELWTKDSEKFEFSKEQDDLAKQILRQKGWSNNQPIVCFLIRDKAYLNTEPTLRNICDWSYHDFRDIPQELFVSSIQYFIERGAYVLRMGKFMERQLTYKHQFYLDYAFSDIRSDFMDAWLFSNCDICVTTGSGPDMIPALNGKFTIVIYNQLNYATEYMCGVGVYLPRSVYRKTDGVSLKPDDVLSSQVLWEGNGATIDSKDLAFSALSEDLILATIKEGWSRWSGIWSEEDDEIAIKERFHKIFDEHPMVKCLQTNRNPHFHFSLQWLKAST